jgi:hypothetical protein
MFELAPTFRTSDSAAAVTVAYECVRVKYVKYTLFEGNKGKGKLSLINKELQHEELCWSGFTDPPILDLSTSGM